MQNYNRVSSGINQLDNLLGGGIIIGDNVVWYDDAGSLAHIFALKFIEASMKEKKSLIYLSFDRSIKNLLEQLGHLANNKYLIILDCFTYGKGKGTDIFLKFYENRDFDFPCQIIRIDNPGNAEIVMDTLFEIHKSLKGDVRFIFESLTSMQELWTNEAQILNFYSHSCPRLYELNTIAYWIIEKNAHSEWLKVRLNKITQVAIDLSIKRGRTYLSILKADKRDNDILTKQHLYWNKGTDITFNTEKSLSKKMDIGNRLKKIRTQKGYSQTELAKLIGVTPSSISQFESNQIYPSLPALIKISEILSTDMISFFSKSETAENQVVFQGSDAVDVYFPGLPKNNIYTKLLKPVGADNKIEPYLIEIPPNKKIPSHFFINKGLEIGYLLSGELIFKIGNELNEVKTGDFVYLNSEIPSQWENPSSSSAQLLWITIKC